ncbi:hypothetical protein MKZ38_002210 [Zalerion maritima]|uniref:Uncharacterized protein n=1 Tax=Zalerion maritima TaxID=339359 RepID=A0AAD5RW50_9PEZI|nr:hypothetical protein MKZ38_002210 [Zalerion maritima]
MFQNKMGAGGCDSPLKPAHEITQPEYSRVVALSEAMSIPIRSNPQLVMIHGIKEELEIFCHQGRLIGSLAAVILVPSEDITILIMSDTMALAHPPGLLSDLVLAGGFDDETLGEKFWKYLV